MAYMSQEKKAKIAAMLKEVMPSGYKYSLSVRDHSEIVLTIASAPIDLVKLAKESGKYSSLDNYVQVNSHYMHEHFKGTEVHELFCKIQKAMYGADYFDDSDIMTDFHHCAYYVSVNIGKWNKPFVVKA